MCGIFGIVTDAPAPVAEQTWFGLQALQHRGQESAGIIVANGVSFAMKKDMGLVSHVFNKYDLEALGRGTIGLGHVRYSTEGASKLENAQPFIIEDGENPFALAHNGEIANIAELESDIRVALSRINARRRARDLSEISRTSTSDSEAIAILITGDEAPTWEERFINVLPKLVGAYSLICATPKKLFALRDPLGIRPLVLGKNKHGWIVASETSAVEYPPVEGTFETEIVAGEVIGFTPGSLRPERFRLPPTYKQAACIFEKVYLAMPTSRYTGHTMHQVRVRSGVLLARSNPAQADIVVGVPDSGLSAAEGFAKALGIPLNQEAIIRLKYATRTFIQPDKEMRKLAVLQKYLFDKWEIRGKRIVLIDDSIVRLNTMSSIVETLKKLGASEIHIRIASPPIKWPCFMGVSMKTTDQFIARNHSIEEIRTLLKVNSLAYLTPEELLEATGLKRDRVCMACMDGNYPFQLPQELAKEAFKK